MIALDEWRREARARATHSRLFASSLVSRLHVFAKHDFAYENDKRRGRGDLDDGELRAAPIDARDRRARVCARRRRLP